MSLQQFRHLGQSRRSDYGDIKFDLEYGNGTPALAARRRRRRRRAEARGGRKGGLHAGSPGARARSSLFLPRAGVGSRGTVRTVGALSRPRGAGCTPRGPRPRGAVPLAKPLTAFLLLRCACVLFPPVFFALFRAAAQIFPPCGTGTSRKSLSTSRPSTRRRPVKDRVVPMTSTCGGVFLIFGQLHHTTRTEGPRVALRVDGYSAATHLDDLKMLNGYLATGQRVQPDHPLGPHR